MDILKIRSEANSSNADSSNPLSDKVSITQTTTVSTDDFDSVDIENKVKTELNDAVSLGVKEKVSLSEDKFKYGIENELGVTTDRGTDTVRSGSEFSVGEKDISIKQTQGHTQKVGNVVYDESSSVNAGYNKNGFFVGQSSNASTKVGNNDAYVKTSSGQSTEFGPGSFTAKGSYGVETKTGPIETGVKQSGSYTNKSEEKNGKTVDTETYTQKTEMSSGVDMGNGVKVKNSVGIEHSEKTSKSDEKTVEESKTSISTKTRIEVDAEQAGVGAAVMAGAFNATQAVKESILKEAMTTTQTTEHSNKTEDRGNEASNSEAYDYYNGYGY